MRAESAPVRVLGKCPAFEAVVMAARVVVMRAPLPNPRNNDKCCSRCSPDATSGVAPRRSGPPIPTLALSKWDQIFKDPMTTAAAINVKSLPRS